MASVSGAQVTTLMVLGFPDVNKITGIAAAEGFLYIANFYDDGDDFGTSLYKVDKATGTYSVGANTAENTGVFIEGNKLFVVGHDIRTVAAMQIDLPTGTVQSVAHFGEYGHDDGVGSSARFYLPNRMGTDGTNLYVLEDAAIRKVTPAGVVTTLSTTVGGGDATSDGTNLFIASGNTVKKSCSPPAW